MSAVVPLVDKLDTRAAADLVETLKAHAGADVTVDASATQQLGAMGLQALMVAATTWKQAGHAFVLTGMSADLVKQFDLYGVDPETLCAKEAA